MYIIPQNKLVDRFPIRADQQAVACRKIARDIRSEHAAGMGPIPMSNFSKLPRLRAADSMDLQAERWEHEMRTGEPNMTDRRKIEAGAGSRAEQD